MEGAKHPIFDGANAKIQSLEAEVARWRAWGKDARDMLNCAHEQMGGKDLKELVARADVLLGE